MLFFVTFFPHGNKQDFSSWSTKQSRKTIFYPSTFLPNTTSPPPEQELGFCSSRVPVTSSPKPYPEKYQKKNILVKPLSGSEQPDFKVFFSLRKDLPFPSPLTALIHMMVHMKPASSISTTEKQVICTSR